MEKIYDSIDAARTAFRTLGMDGEDGWRLIATGVVLDSGSYRMIPYKRADTDTFMVTIQKRGGFFNYDMIGENKVSYVLGAKASFNSDGSYNVTEAELNKLLLFFSDKEMGMGDEDAMADVEETFNGGKHHGFQYRWLRGVPTLMLECGGYRATLFFTDYGVDVKIDEETGLVDTFSVWRTEEDKIEMGADGARRLLESYVEKAKTSEFAL